MKTWIAIIALAMAGCGGSLSDEQRKRLHDGMENQKIMKLSDAEIVSASLDQGRLVFQALEKQKFAAASIDSIAREHHARIRWIKPGSSSALEIENQLIEAYIIGAETGSTQDNIQKLYKTSGHEEYDSLLYSRPIVTPMADGVVNVEGVWNIYLAKKEVIISEGRKH